jgi:hypothetical protein
MRLSVVIPALNEEQGLGDVLEEIPIARLKRMGYETEVVVVDNGSVDNTPVIALTHGATVVEQPARGYGNAYKAGFAYATGDVIATGDADLTYPFSDLPEILQRMEQRQLDFVTTDRLYSLGSGVMSRSHVFGNWLLSLTAKALFRLPFKDSQSGMWVFKRHVWDALDVRSSGMPFSQELKIEAFAKGFKCDQVPIDYRARAGKAKLNTIGDGLGNVTQMITKRMSLGLAPTRAAVASGEAGVGRRSPGVPRPAFAGIGHGETSTDWDERWCDPVADSDRILGERWRHVPRPITGSVGTEEAPAYERRGMVVLRPKPADACVATAAGTLGFNAGGGAAGGAVIPEIPTSDPWQASATHDPAPAPGDDRTRLPAPPVAL